jgi:P4 family phage/plasmid primase-like protien
MNNIIIEDDIEKNKQSNIDSIRIKTKNKSIFLDYIKEKKCNFGEKIFTHTWWDGKNNFTFKIEDDEYENFLELYKEEIKSNYGNLHVMEKPKDTGPLIFDFDFKQTNPERKIEIDDFVQIIEAINSIIKKNFKISKNKNLLEAYVLMKKEPYYDKIKQHYSDGFHIQYKNLIIDTVDRFLIFEESKKEIIRLNLFSEIYEVLKETDKEEVNKTIFDKDVIKKNSWFMYGSGKKYNEITNLYEVVYIFDHNVELLDKTFNNLELAELLAIRGNNIKVVEYKNFETLKPKLEEIKKKYISKVKDKLDINKLFTQNKENNENLEEDMKNSISTKINKLISANPNTIDNVAVAKKLVKLLDRKRAGPYNDWILVGWTLYNISPILLPEFIEFSKQNTKKYQEGCCEKVWEDCSNYNGINGYTIGSLHKWAKEDNMQGYRDMLRDQISKLLEESDIRAEFDMACILETIYRYDYKCSSINKNLWWQFSEHNWKRIDNAYTLSYKISTEVAKEFALIASNYTRQSIDVTGQKSDALLQKSKEIIKLIQDLKKKNPKDKIISQCSILFYDQKFEEKLDQNSYSVGFNNGVYDLQNFIFRKGCPDDYISKTTGYDYNDNFKEEDKIIKEINAFFHSIQPNEEMRKYILCYCASLLEGGNKDQKFMIWTGTGANAKGTLIELLDNTLGDYFGTLPVTLLTQKRKGSSNATPELADKHGTRILILQEPEEDDKINIGFMKELTGQDKIMARPLYGDPFYYVPKFKIILACNKLPTIPSDDGGTWRRIRVIDFGQKFVDNPTLPNEQKKDPELRERLKTWNQAFMWLLLNKYYPMYRKHGLDALEPMKVKLSTSKYKQDSNIYMEYLNEMLDIDEKESIEKELAWRVFKEWYGNSYNGSKPPPQKKLIEFFEINNYRVTKGPNGIISGVKMKEIQL